MDRDRFLAGIRRSLQTTLLPSARAQRPTAALPAGFEAQQLISRFSQEVENLNGQVVRVDSEEAALAQLVNIFTEHQASDYLSWADQFLPVEDLNEKLISQGYNHHVSFVPSAAKARQEVLDRLSAVSVGITGATAGIAESGTVVLQNGPGRGRLASLLPPVHVCLLKVDRLFSTMAHFIEAFPHSVRQTSNLVFITGPSRTADIEQTLTLGVHGPGNLYIVLVT